MKRLLPIFICTLLSLAAFAQNQYEVLSERPNEKTYKGLFSREVIESDTSFKWAQSNYKTYTANPAAKEALEKNRDSIQLLVFMGTWCEDSHFIIPRLFALLDASGFSMKNVTLVGVDRNKTTISHLAEALNVKNVPTIMVMKQGKELGRVIEYGKTGEFDKDLVQILK